MNLLDRPRRLLHEWSTRRKNQRTIAQLEARLATRDPILLVHQMGRAGSMTTVNTLRSAGLDLAIFHTHWLNTRSLETRQAWQRNLPDAQKPLNIRVSNRIAAHLKQHGTKDREWKIVSVFRDPIARNISVFFLSIDMFVKDFQKRYRNGDLSNAELLQIFLDEFPHEEPLVWFEHELNEVFGIDVYQSPFAQEQGYALIQADNVDLLAIKLENLNTCYQSAFQELLKVTIPDLVHTHVTELDPSKPMYKDFVRSSALPSNYLDYMYTSTFAEHFYSKEEIHRLRRKWSEPDE